jgi:hypothetical protein
VTVASAKLRELRLEADRLIDGAFAELVANPESAPKVASLLGPRRVRPLEGWPKVKVQMKPITDQQVTQAWSAVRAVVDVEKDTVVTGFPQYPLASFDFSKGDAEEFAPLISFCLDGTLYHGLARLVFEAHSRFTRSRERTVAGDLVRTDLYPGSEGTALMEQVNKFLQIEAGLWNLARTGGFEGPVPYPVRYETARYLWTPSITGLAFCLRCGTPIQYNRAGRASGNSRRRIPICSPCIRSGSLTWPRHAVMPDTKGKWWLRCQHPDCTTIFRGAGQARYCTEHRSAALTARRRNRRES